VTIIGLLHIRKNIFKIYFSDAKTFKMKTLRLLLFLPVLLLLGTKCNKDEECHTPFVFNNNDTIDVYVLPSFDTTFYIHYASPGDKVDKNSSREIGVTHVDCIEYRIHNEQPPYMSVIVTNVKVAQDSGWDFVSDHRIFLREYKLSVEDLTKLNWEITYP